MREMTLALSGASFFLYLVLYVWSWLGPYFRRKELQTAGPTYSVGLLFATFYYLFLPVMLWRYGWRTTLKLYLFCLVMGILTVIALQFAGVDTGRGIELFVFGQVVQVPIRVFVGRWIAGHDAQMQRSTELARQALVKEPQTTSRSQESR